MFNIAEDREFSYQGFTMIHDFFDLSQAKRILTTEARPWLIDETI